MRTVSPHIGRLSDLTVFFGAHARAGRHRPLRFHLAEIGCRILPHFVLATATADVNRFAARDADGNRRAHRAERISGDGAGLLSAVSHLGLAAGRGAAGRRDVRRGQQRGRRAFRQGPAAAAFVCSLGGSAAGQGEQNQETPKRHPCHDLFSFFEVRPNSRGRLTPCQTDQKVSSFAAGGLGSECQAARSVSSMRMSRVAIAASRAAAASATARGDRRRRQQENEHPRSERRQLPCRHGILSSRLLDRADDATSDDAKSTKSCLFPVFMCFRLNGERHATRGRQINGFQWLHSCCETKQKFEDQNRPPRTGADGPFPFGERQELVYLPPCGRGLG